MRLASLFVEFAAKGVSGVQQALAGVQQQIQNVAAGATAFGQVAEAAFGRAKIALVGVVTAGIAASSTGQVLHFQMEQLSRTVAGLFSPELLKLSQLLRTVTDWFRNLSDAQREMVARFALGGAAALAVATVLPRLVVGLGAAVAAIRAVTTAMVAFNVSTGGIVVAIGAIIAAFAAVGAGAQVVEGGLGKLFSSLQPIFEALSSVFQTLVTAFEPVLAVASKLFTVFAEVAAKLIEAFAPVLEVVALVMTGIGEAILSIMPEIIKTVEILGQAIKTVVDALKPVLSVLMEAFAGILQAITPILPIIAELVAAVVEALAPVFQIVAILLTAVLRVLEPIIRLFVQFARVIVAIITPALKALAVVLEQVARFLAFILGVDLNKTIGGKLDIDGKRKDGRGPASPRVGGFEGLEDAFFRLSLAGIRATAGGGKTVEEKQLDVLHQIEENTGGTRKAIKEKPPVIKDR